MVLLVPDARDFGYRRDGIGEVVKESGGDWNSLACPVVGRQAHSSYFRVLPRK